jgi:aminobenzoyl-glutamate utilization protein A
MQGYLVEQRRARHRAPELGWLEFETTDYLAQQLAAMDYDVAAGSDFLSDAPRLGVPTDGAAAPGKHPGSTGCIAVARGARPGPAVAVRLDIDALPIEEAGVPHRPAAEGFASLRTGVMHACGHDGHIAIGLGLAKLLRPRIAEGRGTLKLIFQPAEEGTRGAQSVVKRGYLDDVDILLGLHLGLGVPSGTVALGTRGFLATRKYTATLRGRPAHAGKAPEEGRNALLAAAQAVLGLHALSQHSEPGVRINVGTMSAGRAANIVPDLATMSFELRAASQKTLDTVTHRATHLLWAEAEAFEVQAEWVLAGEATDAETDPNLAQWAAALGRSMGLFQEYLMDYQFGASEDATLMMQRVQLNGGLAGYFVLGADLAAPHHTSNFDFDESVLFRGVALLAAVTASALDLW